MAGVVCKYALGCLCTFKAVYRGWRNGIGRCIGQCTHFLLLYSGFSWLFFAAYSYGDQHNKA